MDRVINDAAYLNTLTSTLYRNRYIRWKSEVLSKIDSIMESLEKGVALSDVMSEYNLTNRDVALLVRLNYISSEEAESYGLDCIEKSVPN